MLHHHPSVFLTNESRVMAYVSRCLHDVPVERGPKPLLSHSEHFLQIMHHHLRAAVLDLYDELGAADCAFWGDKYPHYADPTADPKCLDTIIDMFPDSRFIHIIRDGRAVVASEVERWGLKPDESAKRWVETIQHARKFGKSLREQYTEVRHDQCVSAPIGVMERLLAWLGLEGRTYDWDWFKRNYKRKVSHATSYVLGDDSWRQRLPHATVLRIERVMGPTLKALGFKA